MSVLFVFHNCIGGCLFDGAVLGCFCVCLLGRKGFAFLGKPSSFANNFIRKFTEGFGLFRIPRREIPSTLGISKILIVIPESRQSTTPAYAHGDDLALHMCKKKRRIIVTPEMASLYCYFPEICTRFKSVIMASVTVSLRIKRLLFNFSSSPAFYL